MVSRYFHCGVLMELRNKDLINSSFGKPYARLIWLCRSCQKVFTEHCPLVEET